MSKQKYSNTTSTSADGSPVKRGRENYNKKGIVVAKRDKRRQEAAARQREYNALTVKERVTRAKARGGSVKELARLAKLTKAAKTTKS